MSYLLSRPLLVVRLSIVLPCYCALALMAIPGHIAFSTYAVLVALLGATVIVGSSTLRHAQAVVSLRQSQYAITHPVLDEGPRTGWDAWVRRADLSAEQGRAQAAMALSITVTTLIVWAWLA